LGGPILEKFEKSFDLTFVKKILDLGGQKIEKTQKRESPPPQLRIMFLSIFKGESCEKKM